MARCINCGKSGLFLRVDNRMRCKACAEKELNESNLKKMEEEDRRQSLEKQERENNISYYNNVCSIYQGLPKGYFYNEDSSLYLDSISRKTIGQLQELQQQHNRLIDALEKRHNYKFFNEFFLKDIIKTREQYGYHFTHRCFPISRHSYSASVDIDVASEVDHLVDYSKRAIAAYSKAIASLETAAHELFPGRNDISKSLRMGYLCQSIAGVGFYEKHLLKLANSNPYYAMPKAALLDHVGTNDEVWKNIFTVDHVELIPEPDNPHDPNAIKVLANSFHIGYIEATKCEKVLELIQNNKILRMTCDIYGGAYKRVREHYHVDKDRETYYLDRGTKPYHATITMITIEWE